MTSNAALAKPTASLQRHAKSATILVVEDDAADTHLIARALRQLPRVGRIEFARDGVEALEWLEGNRITPDLALVDLKMPRMDGFRLLIELSVRRQDRFPIVVLTSSQARRDAVRSLFRGANKVLVKPGSPGELEDFLAEIVNAL